MLPDSDVIVQTEDRQKAQQAWARMCHSLSLIGVQASESKAIFSLLAVIYHLGVAGVAKCQYLFSLSLYTKLLTIVVMLPNVR